MQKILVVMVVCILGGLVFLQVSNSRPVFNEVVLVNVEALADLENTLPTICQDSGDCTCPGSGKKFGIVYIGYSLSPDEETY